MIRYYIVCVEDGELASETTELITCEHCKYFRRADEHEYRYKDSCGHPHGMVRPSPEGFCSYASFKLIEEEDHE